MNDKKILTFMILLTVVVVLICVWFYLKTDSTIVLIGPFLLAVIFQVYGKWRNNRKK